MPTNNHPIPGSLIYIGPFGRPPEEKLLALVLSVKMPRKNSRYCVVEVLSGGEHTQMTTWCDRFGPQIQNTGTSCLKTWPDVWRRYPPHWDEVD